MGGSVSVSSVLNHGTQFKIQLNTKFGNNKNDSYQNFLDTLGRMRQHGLQRNSGRELAPADNPIDALLQQHRNHLVVARALAEIKQKSIET